MKNSAIGFIALSALSLLLSLFLLDYFNLSFPVTVVSTNKSSELSVIGEGKVEVVPDTAFVDVGITINDAKTVDAAQKQINEINNKIIEDMKAFSIAKEDIKTSNYSISPNYSYEGNTNKIIGYIGNAQITIKVRETNKVSEIIQRATAAGANQVNGARFTVDQPEKYREQAREKAIANAKEQANKLASSLGIKLGRIVNIVESSDGAIVPMYDKALALEYGRGAGGASSNPTIEGGSQTITSVVTLYFEKK